MGSPPRLHAGQSTEVKLLFQFAPDRARSVAGALFHVHTTSYHLYEYMGQLCNKPRSEQLTPGSVNQQPFKVFRLKRTAHAREFACSRTNAKRSTSQPAA